MDRIKYLEEQLREGACLGDIETVCELVSKGIDVNAQHEMNGWTSLHWAAKRGQKEIVNYLLKHGADKTLLTSKGETPLALATKPEVRILLGGEPGVTINTAVDLPIVPNYIKNEPLDPRVEIYQGPNRTSHVRSEPDPVDPRGDVYQTSNRTSVRSDPVELRQEYKPNPRTTQNGTVASSSQTSVNQAVQPAQPEELVLKVRIAQEPDDDFIEIELSVPSELTYYSLVNIACRELGIDAPSSILKVRKLPNTIVRKDKDVARLTGFQELELVLGGEERSNGVGERGGLANGVGERGLGLPFGKGVNNYPSIHKFKNQTILY